MEALPDQQAEDHLTEAVFIIGYHFEEPDPHRFRARRTHHGALNLNRCFIGGGFDGQLNKRSLRQGCCRFERAASHGDIRHTIVGPHGAL